MQPNGVNGSAVSASISTTTGAELSMKLGNGLQAILDNHVSAIEAVKHLADMKIDSTMAITAQTGISAPKDPVHTANEPVLQSTGVVGTTSYGVAESAGIKPADTQVPNMLRPNETLAPTSEAEDPDFIRFQQQYVEAATTGIIDPASQEYKDAVEQARHRAAEAYLATNPDRLKEYRENQELARRENINDSAVVDSLGESHDATSVESTGLTADEKKYLAALKLGDPERMTREQLEDLKRLQEKLSAQPSNDDTADTVAEREAMEKIIIETDQHIDAICREDGSMHEHLAGMQELRLRADGVEPSDIQKTTIRAGIDKTLGAKGDQPIERQLRERIKKICDIQTSLNLLPQTIDAMRRNKDEADKKALHAEADMKRAEATHDSIKIQKATHEAQGAKQLSDHWQARIKEAKNTIRDQHTTLKREIAALERMVGNKSAFQAVVGWARAKGMEAYTNFSLGGS